MNNLNLILFVNFALSVLGFALTFRIIPKFKQMSMKANICGVDLGKRNNPKIPKAMGVICGSVFLTMMFLFIPIPFVQYWTTNAEAPYLLHELIEFLAALLSICCILFLGLIDDVFEIIWRCKLFVPTIASIPLLCGYFITYNGTTVIIPKPFRFIFGNDVFLGPLYYVYIVMLVVFCTNAINIYAGINGLEAGQSAVIATSIVTFNIIELFGDCWKAHLFSLYFMPQFLFVTLALLYYNWYPASVFVGDTFCYFAGMTFAVVGIFGHFSKTMLLFFLPQIINFIFSCPQLFHFIPCPRHRLPRFNKELNIMEPSIVTFKVKSLKFLGRFCMAIAKTFRLVNYIEYTKDGEMYAESSNFTLINFMLKVAGPTHERTLTVYLLTIQVLSTGIAFWIRYGLASIIY